MRAYAYSSMYDEMLLRIEPQGAEIWMSNSREDSIDRPYKSLAHGGARADPRAARACGFIG